VKSRALRTPILTLALCGCPIVEGNLLWGPSDKTTKNKVNMTRYINWLKVEKGLLTFKPTGFMEFFQKRKNLKRNCDKKGD
jgi:hypothetical protein